MTSPDFAPGSVVRLRRVRGEEHEGRRLEYALVLLHPEPLNAQHPDMRIAPISLETADASDLDVVCAADEGPVGQPFHVEVWNQREVLVADFEPVATGMISEPAMADVYAAHNSMIGIGRDVSEGRRGPPIVGPEDPRIGTMELRLSLAEQLSRAAEERLLVGPHDRGGEHRAARH